MSRKCFTRLFEVPRLGLIVEKNYRYDIESQVVLMEAATHGHTPSPTSIVLGSDFTTPRCQLSTDDIRGLAHGLGDHQHTSSLLAQ
jgi:hypothetical protein